MSMHALVEKWREAAKSERIIAVTTPGIDKYACQVQARLMDKFADEPGAELVNVPVRFHAAAESMGTIGAWSASMVGSTTVTAWFFCFPTAAGLR